VVTFIQSAFSLFCHWGLLIAPIQSGDSRKMAQTQERTDGEQQCFEIALARVHTAIATHCTGGGGMSTITRTDEESRQLNLQQQQQVKLRPDAYITGSLACLRLTAPREKWALRDVDTVLVNQTAEEFESKTKAVCASLGGSYSHFLYSAHNGYAWQAHINAKAVCKLPQAHHKGTPPGELASLVAPEISFLHSSLPIASHLQHALPPASVAYQVSDPSKWVGPSGAQTMLRLRRVNAVSTDGSNTVTIPAEYRAKYEPRGFVFDGIWRAKWHAFKSSLSTKGCWSSYTDS
jgi:hypothetical protein